MKFPKLHIVRQSSFKATPWKNGGGTTYEVIRVPPTGDSFQWRVSVAHIDVSGPFSDFAGYNRKMVLLRGAGIELRFADGREVTLRQPGDLVEFDGAISTQCELLNGCCVDLNLMVSQSLEVDVRVRRVCESLSLKASGGESTLVFCMGESVRLETETGDAYALGPWDLAVLTQGGASLSSLDSSGSSQETLVFLATLGGV